jgi:8-oxo-dGTP diphosphatase
MTPTWFYIDQIPYQRMWQDGAYWLPPILAGGFIRGDFSFWRDAETITTAEIEVVYQSSTHTDRRSL